MTIFDTNSDGSALKSIAAKRLRYQFTDLGLRAAPRIAIAQNLRREALPAEFLKVCAHPKIADLGIRGDWLIAKTTLVCVHGHELGVYLTGINPVEQTHRAWNLTRTVPAVDGNHHPHIYPSGVFCMGVMRKEFDHYCAGGYLKEAQFLILDMLHTVHDDHAIYEAQLSGWPADKSQAKKPTGGKS